MSNLPDCFSFKPILAFFGAKASIITAGRFWTSGAN
jgi:hypothetical protein